MPSSPMLSGVSTALRDQVFANREEQGGDQRAHPHVAPPYMHIGHDLVDKGNHDQQQRG